MYERAPFWFWARSFVPKISPATPVLGWKPRCRLLLRRSKETWGCFQKSLMTFEVVSPYKARQQISSQWLNAANSEIYHTVSLLRLNLLSSFFNCFRDAKQTKRTRFIAGTMEQGWRNGESARPPLMCRDQVRFPLLASYVGIVCCWFSPCSKSISVSGFSGFPLSTKKTTLPNSNSIRNARTRVERAPVALTSEPWENKRLNKK